MEKSSENYPMSSELCASTADRMSPAHSIIDAIRAKCAEVDKGEDPDDILMFAEGLTGISRFI